ncbi:MAG: hypothetical protein EHM43_11125 [Ignavibacteriae bacterium]|nr:MAG: hypothetical protein EHM43_11125 [Ignavibacteriota bacterium]
MKSLLVALFAVLCLSTDVMAQTTEEINIIQNLYGMEKRSLFIMAMDLSPSDSVSFWPIYDKYEEKRKNIGKERIEWLKKFADKYPAVSSEELDEIVEEASDLNEEFHDLLMDTYKTMRKNTSSMVAAKFYQIESFLNTAINSELQSRLPFIGEFSVKAKK